MKRAVAMLMAVIMVMGLVACGTEAANNDKVVAVPEPEDMTLEFLQEYAKEVGTHEKEGDLYLFEPYLYAVREDGDVVCIADFVMQVIAVQVPYLDNNRIPHDDGIQIINLHGDLMVGTSFGWYMQ